MFTEKIFVLNVDNECDGKLKARDAQTNLLSEIRFGIAKSGALLIFAGSLYVPGPGVDNFGTGSGRLLEPKP